MGCHGILDIDVFKGHTDQFLTTIVSLGPAQDGGSNENVIHSGTQILRGQLGDDGSTGSSIFHQEMFIEGLTETENMDVLMDKLVTEGLEVGGIGKIEIPELGQVDFQITENGSGGDHYGLTEGNIVLSDGISTFQDDMEIGILNTVEE